jgi:membrane associated rhomboid family serine protease
MIQPASASTKLPRQGSSARAGVGQYLRRSVATIGGFIALLWVVWLVNAALLGGSLLAFGILPRTTRGLAGIPLHPLLHADSVHLVHNSFGLLLFGTLTYLKEESDFWLVLIVGTFAGGLAVWLLGRPAIHIGASGVVFAFFGYLVSVGWFERRIGTLILSIVLFLGWGSVLLGVLPLQRGISWEGHLFGFAAGVFAAWSLSRGRARVRARGSA